MGNAPDKSDIVCIDFDRGIPVKITNTSDGKVFNDPLEIFIYCNYVAGKHGIGRIDIVENRFVGIKSRGVYETPGGTLLRIAHLDIESLCMDREVKRITEGLANEFARLCYNGFWFAPEMDLIRNSIEFSQRGVEGVVEIELYKGNCIVRGRESPKALTTLIWLLWILKVGVKLSTTTQQMRKDLSVSTLSVSRRMLPSVPNLTRYEAEIRLGCQLHGSVSMCRWSSILDLIENLLSSR